LLTETDTKEVDWKNHLLVCYINDLGIKDAASYAIASTVERSNNKQINLLVDEAYIECLCEMLNPEIEGIEKMLMAIKKLQKTSAYYNKRI
jgi:hypothetical protein